MLTVHVIRKPLSERTVAANVIRWGTGALNIDASRAGSEGGTCSVKMPEDIGEKPRHECFGVYQRVTTVDADKGRWPANVILDGGEPTKELDGMAPGAAAYYCVVEPVRSTVDGTSSACDQGDPTGASPPADILPPHGGRTPRSSADGTPYVQDDQG